MKWMVKVENRFNTYFYTKKDALAYSTNNNGVIYKKIGGAWYKA